MNSGEATGSAQRYSLGPSHMLFLPPDMPFILVSHQGSDTARQKSSAPPRAEAEHVCHAPGGHMQMQQLQHFAQPGSWEPKGKAVPEPPLYSQGPARSRSVARMLPTNKLNE